MSKRKVTFSDIAKYTHFSKTTISRYFNNPDSVTPENKLVIAKALEELDYQEDKIARVLATGKTEFIGVIVPTMYYHYYSEVLNYLLRTYEQYGYKFLVFVGNGDRVQERRYIQELLSYNIEGLVTMSHAISSAELAAYNIPTVGIEREDTHITSVRSDNYAGSVKATELLLRNGCEVLLHINTFMPRNVPSHGRIQGFLDTCRAAGVSHELVQRKFRDSYEQTNELMHTVYEEIQKKYPAERKGVFLANDTYANLLVNILVREHGGLPDDYRIVGFDNSPIAEQAVIPISTVAQQIQKIAETAMGLLIEQMEQRKREPEDDSPLPIVHKDVTPVLIERSTTK